MRALLVWYRGRRGYKEGVSGRGWWIEEGERGWGWWVEERGREREENLL